MAAAVVTAVTAVTAVVAVVVGAEPFGSAAPHLLTASVSCVSLSFWMLSSSMAVNARESAMVTPSPLLAGPSRQSVTVTRQGAAVAPLSPLHSPVQQRSLGAGVPLPLEIAKRDDG